MFFFSQELYSSSSSAAVPILHDTVVDFRVDKLLVSRLPTIRESESYHSFELDDLDEDLLGRPAARGEAEVVYQVRGQVANPLKLSLCRAQYEQLLDSVKSLSVEADDEEAAAARTSAAPAAEQQQTASRKTSVDSNAAGSSAPSCYEGSFEVRGGKVLFHKRKKMQLVFFQRCPLLLLSSEVTLPPLAAGGTHLPTSTTLSGWSAKTLPSPSRTAAATAATRAAPAPWRSPSEASPWKISSCRRKTSTDSS